MGWLVYVIGVIIVVAATWLVVAVVRRTILTSRGLLFDCYIRPSLDRQRWIFGVASYHGHCFRWFGNWTMTLSPAYRLDRALTSMLYRRPLSDHEREICIAATTVIGVRSRSRDYEIAVNDGAALAMISWLESAPPAEALHYVR